MAEVLTWTWNRNRDGDSVSVEDSVEDSVSVTFPPLSFASVWVASFARWLLRGRRECPTAYILILTLYIRIYIYLYIYIVHAGVAYPGRASSLFLCNRCRRFWLPSSAPFFFFSRLPLPLLYSSLSLLFAHTMSWSCLNLALYYIVSECVCAGWLKSVKILHFYASSSLFFRPLLLLLPAICANCRSERWRAKAGQKGNIVIFFWLRLWLGLGIGLTHLHVADDLKPSAIQWYCMAAVMLSPRKSASFASPGGGGGGIKMKVKHSLRHRLNKLFTRTLRCRGLRRVH